MNKLGITLMIGLILSFCGNLFLLSFIGVNDCKEVKQTLHFETIELADYNMVTDTYDYYTLASNFYDISDYTNTIFYCEKSRKVSSEYSQKLRDIKAEYPDKLNDALTIRREMIEVEIEYLFALYESCEYIESASRSYEQEDYDMGAASIEGQNDAISKHDELVEDYYNLESKYNKAKRLMLE